jgi:Archaeal flavoproteins
MAKVKTPRWGWALTGSGHFFKECLAMIHTLDEVDLFVTRAAAEVVRMYKQELTLPKSARIFRDTAASAPPVGNFYYNVYHTLVVAPATSNTVAKCVYGISDNLATNVFAQAGKCRVPSIVFACDTAPELETEAPKGDGQSVPAPHRSRKYRATESVRTNAGRRNVGRPGAGSGAAQARSGTSWLSPSASCY